MSNTTEKKHQGSNPALVFNPQVASQNRDAIQKEINANVHKKGHMSLEVFKKSEEEKMELKIFKTKHNELNKTKKDGK
jgi:hypothetical protein